CEIGTRLDVDLELIGKALHPCNVLVARAGIDDHAEPGVIDEKDNEIVDYAALFVQQAAVQSLAGLLQLGDVVGEQMTQVVTNAGARDIDGQHVGNVEH